jgi:hypothetical protein
VKTHGAQLQEVPEGSVSYCNSDVIWITNRKKVKKDGPIALTL